MARRLAAMLLLAAALAGLAVAQPACRTFASKGVLQPASGSLQDVIVVQDAFLVGDVSSTLDLSHPRIGALKITLAGAPFSSVGGGAAGAGPGSTVITLKSQGLGRRGDNLYRTTFSDAAPAAFPANASGAPFTGTFRPSQKLAFLADGAQQVAGAGGSQGLWTLAVTDLAPNATLREIALNGWSLVLCPRPSAGAGAGGVSSTTSSPALDGDLSAPPPPAAPAATPSPSPEPAFSPAPAPPVNSFAGPADAGAAGTPPLAIVPGVAEEPRSMLGWKVVYKGQAPPTPTPLPTATATATGGATGGLGLGLGLGFPPAADAGTLMQQLLGAVGAGAAAGAAQQPLKQLLAQRPVLSMLQQQIAAIASGVGGTCDEACQQAKQNLWRAAVVTLWVRNAGEVHGVTKELVGKWLDRMQKLLPGENSKLAKLSEWVEVHESQLAKLAAWLREHVQLPEGLPQLPQLQINGKGQALQQLTAAFASGDKLQQLMGVLAAAGDKLSAATGAMLGGVDAKGEALHAFLSSMEGGSPGQVAQQSVDELAQQLAGMFSFGAY